MPLQKLQLRPGVNRESTTLANEGTWFEMDKVRFRSGYPEKLGGWVADTGTATSTPPPSSGSFWGVCRSLWNWITLTGVNLMGLGTNLKYYIQPTTGGSFYDVTPIRKVSTVASGAFFTQNEYEYITVNDPGYGGQTGDFVTISGVTGTINGVPASELNREFQIQYIDASRYDIMISGAFLPTSTGTTGSGTFTYQIAPGSAVATVGVGWGTGFWGGTNTVLATTTLTSTLSAVPITVLASAVSNSVTTLPVATTTGFAASGSLLIGEEILTYSGKTTTSFTGCVRGAVSFFSYAHAANTGVIQYSLATIAVTSTTGFSASGAFVVDSEYITYTGKTSTTFTGCIRGFGSTPSAHSVGATVNQNDPNATAWGIDFNPTAAEGVDVQLRLWSQTNYGQDLVINPRGGPLYLWKVNAASQNTYDRAVLLASTSPAPYTTDTSCPKVCNIVAVSDASRFVIAFGCNDPIDPDYPDRLDPLLIRWSDQENYAVWAPLATNQAGSYRLSTGSTIVAQLQTRQEILVWTDAALYTMQYLGPPYVWGFQIMGANISIAGPNAVATAANITYWMGLDKFYMYSGRVETLYCPLRQYVFGDINLQQQYQFFASTNEGFNEVWWFYCSISGPDGTNTAQDPNTLIDRYVIYNHLEKIWSYGNLSRTAWLDTPLRDFPVAAGYVEPVAPSTEYNGQLIYHENGVNDGTTNPPTAITSYIQSADFNIGDGHNYGFVWRMIPDITFDGSFVNNPSVTFTMKPRQNPGANYSASNTPAVTSAQNYQAQRNYVVQQFTQIVYTRVRGRQMAFRISSDGLGVQWQLGVPAIDVRPDGRR